MFSKFVFRFAISVSAVALSLVADSVYAQGARKVINAITITYYPPYEFKDPATNKLQGFEIDVLEAMAAKMGAKVNWIESSYAQLTSFSDIFTGRADIATAITDNPQRRRDVDVLDWAYFTEVFYTLSNDAERYANIDALCGKRVGATRSSPGEMDGIARWSEENCTKAGKPAIVLVPGENTPQVRLMLESGRVDAAIISAAVLAYQNRLEGNKLAKIGTDSVIKFPSGMGISKNDPKFGADLKKALGAIIADGTYGQILRKWGLPDEMAIREPMINGEP